MNTYNEKMRDLVEQGKIDLQEATNRVHGFKAACEGKTFEEYTQELIKLIEIGYMEKSEANANLQGYNDLIRQNF